MLETRHGLANVVTPLLPPASPDTGHPSLA
jgi:hypothetical protein